MSPDFDVAIKRHQLLDAIQNASDTGMRENFTLGFRTVSPSDSDARIGTEKRACIHDGVVAGWYLHRMNRPKGSELGEVFSLTHMMGKGTRIGTRKLLARR